MNRDWSHIVLTRPGRFFFRFRNILFPAVFALLLAFAEPARFLGNAAADIVAAVFGIACLLAGQGFRLAVIGYAYIRRGGKNREVHANELVTRGFYAHTRNPMYVGNFMVVFGLALLYGSPWAYLGATAFFAWVYLAIVAAEETYLREKFGAAYEDYTRTVNRFVPDFRGLSASLAEFAYDWRRALAKEYNTLCFNLAAALGVAAYKTVQVYGYAGHETLTNALGVAFVPLALFYAAVRFLKKTRRLRPARSAETEREIADS